MEAKALHSSGDAEYSGDLCGNTSKLFVAEGTRPFRTVLAKSYQDGTTDEGNSLRIVDWSPDSSEILVELVTWRYETHGLLPKTALLYFPKTAALKQIELTEIFLQRFGDKCPLELRTQGFSRDGDIVVNASTYRDLDEEYDSCGLTGYWLVRNSGKELVRLPKEFKVNHYGH